MNNTEIFDKVQKIVSENLNTEEAKISESSDFVNDLGADSLDQVELVMAFEEEFAIEIPDDAAEKIRTIKDAVEYIENNKK